ncbi:hypothetical protein A203_20335 [Chromobacterium violaceum]
MKAKTKPINTSVLFQNNIAGTTENEDSAHR